MEVEGVTFKTNANVGVNVKVNDLMFEYDAIVLAGGSTIPRDLKIPGRELKGVHFAMEFLPQQNKVVSGKKVENQILATGKNVWVIGGGDTGSDCVGTSNRQGAKSVTQIELLAKPPEGKNENTPWPNWPMILRTSTSHEEGCERKWAINTKEFIGDGNGNLKGIKTVEVEWTMEGGVPKMIEKPGTEQVHDCELALIAAGFLYPQREGMLTELGVELDERGNVKTNNYQTSISKVFAAGDMRRGQSLVVWAISEGRECARAVDLYLMGETKLEAKDAGLFYVEA
jgi:glutamate synthase (NADPH/NADH) small chain